MEETRLLETEQNRLNNATPRLQPVPSALKRRDIIKVQYGECCSDTPPQWLYNFCCASCLAAEAKANLDGRDCSCCDCICGAWPLDQLFPRRQLRMKYGLAFDKAPHYCEPTMWVDVWVPVMMLAVNMCIPTCISAVTGSNTAWVVGTNFAIAVWITVFPCTRITRLEAVRRTGNVLSYGPTHPGAISKGVYPMPHPRLGGGEVYTSSLCGCLLDMESCCYVSWLWPCALGSAGALAQGRDCDCFDACSPPTSWQLRKSVKAKYGMSQLDTCEDCMTVTCAAPCAVCQDYRELKNRHSKKGYLPWDPQSAHFYLPRAYEHRSVPKAVWMMPPHAQTMDGNELIVQQSSMSEHEQVTSTPGQYGSMQSQDVDACTGDQLVI